MDPRHRHRCHFRCIGEAFFAQCLAQSRGVYLVNMSEAVNPFPSGPKLYSQLESDKREARSLASVRRSVAEMIKDVKFEQVEE